ncbi:MAG: hypothetical protein IJZ85_09800 [Lachnospiraceae bacterium]|nr:hypothetical protein [Lachnospiraceae bacterium]
MRKYPLNLHRFDEKIAVLETQEDACEQILLYGSSFFNNWTEAKEQMLRASDGKYHVVNHGFGGATVDELLYFYRKLVVPYSPKAVIFRIGPNDIFNGFSAEEAWNMAWRLMEFLRADYPGIKLILLCVFDYKSVREEHKTAYAKFNAYQREYAVETDNVWYLDINDFFYERTEDIGTFQGFRDIFREDGLHLLPDAYVEFAEYLTKKLENIL